MAADCDTFCVRVAEETQRAPPTQRMKVIQFYLESVAGFIDAARPHTKTLWEEFGPTSEWKEARLLQTNMCLVVQNLDEIHHRVETGDLDEALSLNLLSFQ